MTSEKAYALEKRFNDALTGGVIAPLFVIKPTDLARQTNVLADDPDLQLNLEANATYMVSAGIWLSSGTGQHFQWKWAGPAGFSFRFGGVFNNRTSGVAGIFYGDETSNPSTAGLGVTYASAVPILTTGSLVTAATPGPLVFRWAQFTAGAFDTTVWKGSFLSATRTS